MPADLDLIIKALAHPVRRDILDWLKHPAISFPNQQNAAERGVSAGLIDQRTGLSQSTASAHLSTLQRAGLVTCTRSGPWRLFKRNESVIQAFLQTLNHQL